MTKHHRTSLGRPDSSGRTVRRGLAIAIVAAVGLLGSCSGQADSGPEDASQATALASPDDESLVTTPLAPQEPSVTSAPVSATGAASEYPVLYEWREYIGMGPLDDLSKRAYVEYQRRTQACMVSRGFEYIPIQFDVPDIDLRRAQNPLNEAVAAQWGYHAPPAAFEEVVDRNLHSPAFDEALNGPDYNDPGPGQSTQPPAGQPGCAQQAGGVVFPITEPVMQVAQELLDSLYNAVDGYQASSEGQVVLAEWVECIRDQGYELTSPRDGLERYAGADEVTAEELATRTADLQCDRTTGLTAAQSAWERQRFDRWQQDFATQWNDLIRLIATTSQTLNDLESETDLN